MGNKKLWVLCIVLLCLTLAGCTPPGPKYVMIPSYRLTQPSIHINIDKQYRYDDANPYNIVETEDGIDVIVHFKKVK